MASPTSDESSRWRDLVGGFILSCGDIELISFRLWEDLCKGKKLEKNLKPRLRELIKAQCAKGPGSEAKINLLNRALNLADKRNVVAHNPLQVQVYQHSHTGELLFEYAISGSKAEDYIDDLELIELRAEAESIVASLYIEYQLALLPTARS